jgi:transcriptional regulator GlxA family with amidase domain
MGPMRPPSPREVAPDRVRVSLVALPDAFLSCLVGLYDTFNVSAATVVPGRLPFDIEIVGQQRHVDSRASGLPITAHRTISEVADTDVVIVPSSVTDDPPWAPGRYPDVVDWLRTMYRQGAVISSACSGALLLAEAGLLDGQQATTHWNEAERFVAHFPRVELRLERELVVSGRDGRIVTAGAASAWHDLALYLVARYSGPDVARAVAKFFMLQWHSDGQTPYLGFDAELRHGDAPVLRAQSWLDTHLDHPDVLAGMAAEAGLPERTFTRRFRLATGHPPTTYVQHVRVEAAKRLLETTRQPVEQICWNVGYDDPASFRRLFKRITGITPGAYRRKFVEPLGLADPR